MMEKNSSAIIKHIIDLMWCYSSNWKFSFFQKKKGSKIANITYRLRNSTISLICKMLDIFRTVNDVKSLPIFSVVISWLMCIEQVTLRYTRLKVKELPLPQRHSDTPGLQHKLICLYFYFLLESFVESPFNPISPFFLFCVVHSHRSICRISSSKPWNWLHPYLSCPLNESLVILTSASLWQAFLPENTLRDYAHHYCQIVSR